jgi:hypothetical protein
MDYLPMFLYTDEKAGRIVNEGLSDLELKIISYQARLKEAKILLELAQKKPKNDAYAQSEIYCYKSRIEGLELALQTLERMKNNVYRSNVSDK